MTQPCTAWSPLAPASSTAKSAPGRSATSERRACRSSDYASEQYTTMMRLLVCNDILFGDDHTCERPSNHYYQPFQRHPPRNWKVAGLVPASTMPAHYGYDPISPNGVSIDASIDREHCNIAVPLPDVSDAISIGMVICITTCQILQLYEGASHKAGARR